MPGRDYLDNSTEVGRCSLGVDPVQNNKEPMELGGSMREDTCCASLVIRVPTPDSTYRQKGRTNSVGLQSSQAHHVTCHNLARTPL